MSGARKDQQPGVWLGCTQMTEEKKRLAKERGDVRRGNGVAELPHKALESHGLSMKPNLRWIKAARQISPQTIDCSAPPHHLFQQLQRCSSQTKLPHQFLVSCNLFGCLCVFPLLPQCLQYVLIRDNWWCLLLVEQR